MVTVTINSKPVEVEDDATILDAAGKLDIKIPTLCHLKLEDLDLENKAGSCRVCVVEVEGRPNLAPSCCTPVQEGMAVKTNSVRAINARRTMLDLLLSNHPKDCLTCERNLNCELQSLSFDMGLHRILYEGEQMEHPVDLANEAIVRDPNKCIMCRRCETACNEMQTVGILSAVNRGFDSVVMPTSNRPLADTKCTFCGQCVQACPTGALTAVNRTYDVWRVLNDPDVTVVVQTAPAVRVAIGELFGYDHGTINTGKLVSALRHLGFDKVFDTDFAADLTIMEETTELIDRLKTGENLPILTSCCPGWVKFFEHQFPDLIHIPSSAKSPQQMFGAIAKTYYAEKLGITPEKMVVVSIMPCLAKKHEASRDEFAPNGVRDVDIVISTRELGNMIKEAGIQFDQLEDADYDDPLGESSGAGVIFGATGGVLEAALRTAADWVSGESLDDIDFEAVRGLTGIKEATVTIAGNEIKAAIASGLGNARALLESIRRGDGDYHAIEIMACPGGCINGGGQPYLKGDTSILEKRCKALYDIDGEKKIRKSHENPSIKRLYKEFLGEPGSKKAHELLHTHYTERQNA
jgi:NADH-quinone oxidoreductase subunit G